jgi:hypothetical protein
MVIIKLKNLFVKTFIAYILHESFTIENRIWTYFHFKQVEKINQNNWNLKINEQ